MLRRLARIVGVGLFALGTVFLIWLPVSYFVLVAFFLSSPRWMPEALVLAREGAVAVSITVDSDQRITDGFQLVYGPIGLAPEKSPTWSPLLPRITRPFVPEYNHTRFAIPLWLLAAICLAWPVTSFIIHRRRHKRGFPVEPADSTPLPRAGEVPSVSASEAERV